MYAERPYFTHGSYSRMLTSQLMIMSRNLVRIPLNKTKRSFAMNSGFGRLSPLHFMMLIQAVYILDNQVSGLPCGYSYAHNIQMYISRAPAGFIKEVSTTLHYYYNMGFIHGFHATKLMLPMGCQQYVEKQFFGYH